MNFTLLRSVVCVYDIILVVEFCSQIVEESNVLIQVCKIAHDSNTLTNVKKKIQG